MAGYRATGYMGGMPEALASIATEADLARSLLHSAHGSETSVRNSLHREGEVNY